MIRADSKRAKRQAASRRRPGSAASPSRRVSRAEARPTILPKVKCGDKREAGDDAPPKNEVPQPLALEEGKLHEWHERKLEGGAGEEIAQMGENDRTVKREPQAESPGGRS